MPTNKGGLEPPNRDPQKPLRLIDNTERVTDATAEPEHPKYPH